MQINCYAAVRYSLLYSKQCNLNSCACDHTQCRNCAVAICNDHYLQHAPQQNDAKMQPVANRVVHCFLCTAFLFKAMNCTRVKTSSCIAYQTCFLAPRLVVPHYRAKWSRVLTQARGTSKAEKTFAMLSNCPTRHMQHCKQP